MNKIISKYLQGGLESKLNELSRDRPWPYPGSRPRSRALEIRPFSTVGK